MSGLVNGSSNGNGGVLIKWKWWCPLLRHCTPFGGYCVNDLSDTCVGLSRTLYMRCIYGVWHVNHQIYSHVRRMYAVVDNHICVLLLPGLLVREIEMPICRPCTQVWLIGTVHVHLKR